MNNNLNDAHSLSHTKWNCKYHVVFAPKYRPKAFLWRAEIGNRSDTATVVPMEGRQYTRSRSVYRPCAYVAGDPAEDGSVKLYGISQREE